MSLKKIAFLLSFFPSFLFGQFGLSGGFTDMNYRDWKSVVEPSAVPNDNILDYAPFFGIDYRLKMSSVRIEFTPGIDFSNHKGTFVTPLDITQDLDVKMLGARFDVNFYPLDWEGDCNCPTWSKDGNVFNKGFFLQVSPGVDWVRGSFQTTQNFTQVKSSRLTSALAYSIGAGLGLDIGLSDLLTLTPIVTGRYFMNYDFDLYPQEFNVSAPETDGFQVIGALRLGINFPSKRGGHH